MRPAFGLAVICALLVRADDARPSTQAAPDPTEGRLVTAKGDDVVDVPLAHTEVRIRVDGHLAEATVTQTFHNPYDDKIDAVYLFPLPTDAAVTSLTIETGGRTIEGTIRERDEAKRVYERARNKGHVAALLTQERPNLFSQSVANIEPGATIDVTLGYVHAPTYEDGAYELVFPMVAGPRYVPDGAGDAASVQPAVLPPGKRSSHDIALYVEIDAGVPVRAVESPTHDIEIARDAQRRRAAVSLAPHDTIPNKDFVVRYQVAGEAPELAVLAHRADDGPGSLFLIAQPPAEADDGEVAPREIVFVLDTSSSMAGDPLAKAKRVIRRVLEGMRPDDTFQIVRFDDGASALGPDPIANKPANLRYVFDWLDALDAAGGTDMTRGIEAALAVPHDPLRLRIVAFLTDGYIGNEDEILKLVDAELGSSRLFSFGVGSSVNRYLLEEMALLGRGDAQIVTPAEDTGEVVERFYRRIDRAVLTDVHIDWGDLAVTDVVPAAAPDLFVGQPLVLSGHYTEPGAGTVTVRGVRAGRDVTFEVPVTLPDRRDRPAVATVWARRRIAELSRDLLRRADDALVDRIVALSLAHRVLTRYTAFVAVDTSRVTDGGQARPVKVPVEVPAGVRRIQPVGGGGSYGYGAIGVGAYGGMGKGAGSYSMGSSFGAAAPKATVAPRVVVGRAMVRGDLDKDIIRRHIEQRTAQVRHCYEKQLVSDPDLEGTVTVSFSVGGDGKVAELKASGLGNAEVEACVADVIRGIEFPATGEQDAVIQINYPFVFRRAGKDE